MTSPNLSLSYQARREVLASFLPHYCTASSVQKSLLLDTFVRMTGYARKSAIRLLNHPPSCTGPIRRPRLPVYGPEVQQALFLAWKAARYICAKRLIPFLPTLAAFLERQGYLQLSEVTRSHLLSMSVTTAERLLRTQRKPAACGLSTTTAGSLLKQQIPIRTFEDWDESQPGFVEADLVAHGGGGTEGNFLHTLTLTDIATGWTECLPLLYKSQDAVLSALQQARRLFPFPILGLDVDNGGEFINRSILAYCEAERITFTRGRPSLKADQCHVEQKNGAVVRAFIGHDRLMGQQAYRQLRELYRVVRLYVNCFQPSMKLLTKYCDGERVRRVYDPAKTPLQRLLLSGVLPEAFQDHLREVAEALDPLTLCEQVEQLQKALQRPAIQASPLTWRTLAASIQRFAVERCLPGSLLAQKWAPSSTLVRQTLRDELHGGVDWLDWPRTSRDPFAGAWELILSLALAHPEWSGSELFREMQRLSPGCYRPSHQSTLQLGLRKIRARLLSVMEEPWPEEVIQASECTLVRAEAEQQEKGPSTDPSSPPLSVSKAQTGAGEQGLEPVTEEESRVPQEDARAVASQGDEEESQQRQGLRVQRLPTTIEGGIHAYVQEQEARGCRSKTLEWHLTALRLFQQYLVNECHLRFVNQITEREVGGWVAHLSTSPASTGTSRSATTIATYARSARAWCYWLVHTGALVRTPFVKGTVPQAGKKAICLLEAEEFERLLLAARPGGEGDPSGEWATARNRAILWVFLETGMRVSELCRLRLGDVDREQRVLRVEEPGGKERGLALSPNGWSQFLYYLELYRPKEACSERGRAQQDQLFLSEWYRPLTVNGITLLFDRLKKRAGISDKRVSPSVLRDTFAVRYLQAGGGIGRHLR